MFKKKFGLLLFASSLAVSVFSTSAIAGSIGKKPLPISQMKQDFKLSSVRISPNGKYIAGISSIEGQENPIVRIWETSDMSKAPKQFGSKSMRFQSVSFVKDDTLFLVVGQPVRRGAKSDWEFSGVFANLDGSKITELANQNATNTRDDDFTYSISVFNNLPLDPDNVLIKLGKESGTEIVKANIRTGKTTRYIRSAEDEAFEWDDPSGNIRVKYNIKSVGGVWYKNYFFRDNDGKWIDLPGLKQSLNDRYTLSVQHVSNDGKTIWVITDKDTDYAVLKKFDVTTQTFSDTIAKNTEYDLASVSFGSAKDEYHQNSDPIRDVCWNGPTFECTHSDETDQGIYDLLTEQFPGTIVSFRVKDKGNLVLASIQAPNLPPTYYLLKNKKELVKIGSYIDGWDQSNLAPAEWVNYPARDGLKIPAILYLPKGYEKGKDGTLPLVVLPHGGPWSYDTIDFDSSYWPQMFATRGFAVLQPNYRGSEGLGKKLWKDGDKQWGLRMSDDNDDGAKWLVSQGIADPNRMMIYGYSYGGFAAAAAAARSGNVAPGLYQCAISGGPAIDLVRIKNDWGENRLQRVTQGVTVDGWNPMAHLDEVKIPWLIVHGGYDHQADILHSRDAAAKMKSVNPNADFKFVEIDRMSHTLNKMLPEHKERLMSEVLNWTANHCGNISKSFNDPEAENLVKKFDKAK